MSRDHRRLRVFADAHALALAVYKETRHFPRDEWFGLRSQMRRSAVSVPANLVEGSARFQTKEYCNFVNIAVGSASELTYLIHLASELHYWPLESAVMLRSLAERVVRQLKRLHAELDGLTKAEVTRARTAHAPSPKPKVQIPNS